MTAGSAGPHPDSGSGCNTRVREPDVLADVDATLDRLLADQQQAASIRRRIEPRRAAKR